MALLLRYLGVSTRDLRRYRRNEMTRNEKKGLGGCFTLLAIVVAILATGLARLDGRVRQKCREGAVAIVADNPGGIWAVVDATACGSGRAAVLEAPGGSRYTVVVFPDQRPDVGTLVTGDKLRLEFSNQQLSGSLLTGRQPLDWLRVVRQ